MATDEVPSFLVRIVKKIENTIEMSQNYRKRWFCDDDAQISPHGRKVCFEHDSPKGKDSVSYGLGYVF